MSSCCYNKDKRMSWTEGDWMCAACQHHNFRQRDACQRCGYPKLGGSSTDVRTYLDNRTSLREVLAGDWFCTTINCRAHNYASRSNCYRCAALKNVNVGQSVIGSESGSSCSYPPGWKTGDWICNRMGCGTHNYAWRTQCYKCKTTKED